MRSTALIWKNKRRYIRGVGKNLLSVVSPTLTTRIRHHTGRGTIELSAPELAEYATRVFVDYLTVMGQQDVEGATIVEYGPGDYLGCAVLSVANGATQVYCVDRFPLLSSTSHYADAYHSVLAPLDELRRSKGYSCFINCDPALGLKSDGPIRYLVDRKGCSGLHRAADVAWSRAVLEHTSRPRYSQQEIATALRKGGRSLHQIDLRSHGMFGPSRTSMDFLCVSDAAWKLMASHSGIPNRMRASQWRALAEDVGLTHVETRILDHYSSSELDRVRPCLAASFQDLCDDDLLSSVIWLLSEQPA